MMEQMTLEEARKSEVEILDVVAKFCDEHKIKYWINCGTLLGAIRHKGFIPWDDDIDVGMLRPEYERFMKEFNGYNPKYEFCCPENRSDWPLAFGKVLDTDLIGVGVDIFFYDNAPDDDDAVKKIFQKRDELYRMNRIRFMKNIFSHVRGNIFRKISGYAGRLLIKLLPKSYFVKKIVKNSKSYISEGTKRVGDFSAFSLMVCDKDIFDSFIEVEFEGRKYKAPVEYDKLLRAFYGDYMQLPPVEERVGHADFAAYRKTPKSK